MMHTTLRMCACHRLDRRSFIKGSLALLGTGITPHSSLAGNSTRIKAAVVADLSLQSREGDTFEVNPRDFVISKDYWKYSIGPMANEMARIFGLTDPPFYLLAVDDSQQPSYAAVDGRMPDDPRYDGVVVIGEAMTQQLFSRFGGALNVAPVAASIAHEVAHIFQFRKGPKGRWWDVMLDDDGQRTRRRAELHADYLAGWCIGTYNFTDPGPLSMDLIARKMYELSSAEGNDPNNHGSRQQRYAAVIGGYFLGRNDKASLADAATAGQKFVNGMVSTGSER